MHARRICDALVHQHRLLAAHGSGARAGGAAALRPQCLLRSGGDVRTLCALAGAAHADCIPVRAGVRPVHAADHRLAPFTVRPGCVRAVPDAATTQRDVHTIHTVASNAPRHVLAVPSPLLLTGETAKPLPVRSFGSPGVMRALHRTASAHWGAGPAICAHRRSCKGSATLTPYRHGLCSRARTRRTDEEERKTENVATCTRPPSLPSLLAARLTERVSSSSSSCVAALWLPALLSAARHESVMTP